ncbi:MAG: UvrD-helicase domain-containing protein [Magnetococcales bacterium]|nr:UvrD-helicase domain-containing protein [Magnetococcales bacterium]
MSFIADLHIHSKYSRATSRECDLENLALWSRKKGVSVLGTGDFTHPAWFEEISTKLVAAEPGLFRLREELERGVESRLKGFAGEPIRFQLTVEISTIYKSGPKTRKVHHLISMPDLEAAQRFNAQLDRIGNIHSDGRPILGLDSRDLLEIVLASGEGGWLIPAHIWTPWFSMLGSKSGFDSVAECYRDLAPHIFALETGLSSDPPMNWQISGLDDYRLVSNSDAHSPMKLGREATRFETPLDYFAMVAALKSGVGYGGTLEFFPEEGKYHLDGHRKCGVRLEPEETREREGLCPSCGKPVVVGVLNRVEELSDRQEGIRPQSGGDFTSLIPLQEIISEIEGVGPGSKRVQRSYETLLSKLGPELYILEKAPLEDLHRAGSERFAEAISRLRESRVIRQGGYDGAFGVIRLFEPDELVERTAVGVLFDPAELAGESPGRDRPAAKTRQKRAPRKKKTALAKRSPVPAKKADPALAEGGILAGLDPEQRLAAEATRGPVMILAGPGTGKTRTLTRRLCQVIQQEGVAPEAVLALTFTRRAAGEMAERLVALLPGVGDKIPVMTFHALGWSMVREHFAALGFEAPPTIASDIELTGLLRELIGLSAARAAKRLGEISRIKGEGRERDDPFIERWQQALGERGWVDLDDLIGLPLALLDQQEALVAHYRGRYPWVSVDEFQDVDGRQYRLLRHLVPSGGNLCVIGDPDQAIYGFRGGDVRFFTEFERDFEEVRAIRLSRSYRSGPLILAAAGEVMAASEMKRERELQPMGGEPLPVGVHGALSEKAEAEFIVQTLERLLGGHSFFSVDSGRADGEAEGVYGFADFAVLYRTDTQGEVMAEALQRSGIPYQKRSHNRLLDHPGVGEVVARMGEGEGSVLQRLLGDVECPEAVGELLKPLAEACGGDWGLFQARLSMGAEVDCWEAKADRVTLMTLHGSKGLEFPVVFMVGCEEGVLPLAWGKAVEDLEEERRLFFVGMTRAKERLFLSHAKKRLWRGKVREGERSRFLQGISEGLLEHHQAPPLPKKKPKPFGEQLSLFGDEDV